MAYSFRTPAIILAITLLLIVALNSSVVAFEPMSSGS